MCFLWYDRAVVPLTECRLMLDNHAYNLMTQLVQEHKSLWRIRNEYSKDAGDCVDCKAFWTKLEKDKEDHVQELTGLIKKHLG